MAHLTVANDEGALARLAAERVTQVIERAVARNATAVVSLTGGTTPQRLYSTLADDRQPWRSRIPWSRVELFWGDERHVPPDHPDSNYGMAQAALLNHVPVPVEQVHRIRAEMRDPHQAAADYERTIDAVASALGRTTDMTAGVGRIHLFDLMLLGLGEDSHIASIFPGGELVDADGTRPGAGRRAAAVWAPHLQAWRITLTPDTLLDSETIVMLVAGANKARAVHAVLRQTRDVPTYPAQLLSAAEDRLEWFVDRAAASRL